MQFNAKYIQVDCQRPTDRASQFVGNGHIIEWTIGRIESIGNQQGIGCIITIVGQHVHVLFQIVQKKGQTQCGIAIHLSDAMVGCSSLIQIFRI
jgi:hypothetical protein